MTYELHRKEDIAKVREALEAQKEYIESRLSVHDNIRADDDQYEDPEEWELRPKLKSVLEALAILDAGKSVDWYGTELCDSGERTVWIDIHPMEFTKEDV